MTLPMTAFKFHMPDLIASRSDDGQMRLEGVASSTVRDHHGDTISEKALRKMASAAEGMVVFMNHSYEVPKDVFGSVEKAMIHKTGEKDARTGESIVDMRIGVVVAKSNPQALETFELIEKDKVGLGISIGAMLPEGGYVLDKDAGGRLLIDDIDLVEASIVSIPANPRAFVDYAVKSVFGAYPTLFDKESESFSRDNPRFEKNRTLTLQKLASGVEGVQLPEQDPDEDEDEQSVEAPSVEPTVTDDSSDDGSGLPESADGAETEGTVVERSLEPGEKLAEATELVETMEAKGATHEPIPGPGQDHLELGEPLAVEAGEDHTELAKAKSKKHQHPHAHAHEHEHEHGFEGSKTVHSHGHAHQHSHDHGPDHDHDDTSNDYSHDHPHNGAWNDEDHPHGDGTAKAASEPDLQKTKVTVWENADGSRTTEVDTGRQRAKADTEDQSVQASLEPETTGGPAGAEASTQVITASADPVDEEILSTLKAITARTQHDAGSVVKTLTAALTASREEVKALKSQNHQMYAVAKAAIEGTQEILLRVGRLPAGRKTVEFGEIKKDFEDLSDIYDESIRKAFKQSQRS